MSRAVAVAFDLDGTLLSLPVDIAAVRRAIADACGGAIAPEEMRPVLARIDELAARGLADRAALRALVDAGELAAAARATAVPGAAETLAALGARGVPLGLVTNNGRACVAGALATAGLGALDAFAAVITRDDVALPKPDPEGVMRAARALLPDGGTLCYVGDSPLDEQAARAARVPGCAVAFVPAGGPVSAILAALGASE